MKVGLLGLGTVGTGTAEILLNPSGRNPLLNEIEIAKVGVRSLSKPRTVEIPSECLTTDLESIVKDPEINIIVELIGGIEPARSLILSAIAHGKHIVTANKAVIARHGDEIYTAATKAGVYVLLEAAVGGGIPIIQPLKQSLGANVIHRVTGIINGTTNYILTQMQTQGTAFEDVLAEAQRLGYAEADPTADVEGFDAADKISILASLAFQGRIHYDDIEREGITSVNVTDINYAEQLGFVVKLLAIAQRDEHTHNSLQVRVGPTLVPKNHPLASVNGVFNAILVEADPLGQVMFYGPGAGKGATASAVVSDLLNIVSLLKNNTADHPLLTCSHQDYCTITPIEELETRFYARFLCGDRPGVIGYLGTTFAQADVSIESVVQIGFQGNLAEVVVVTHDVLEEKFRKAIHSIEREDINVASVLRVL